MHPISKSFSRLNRAERLAYLQKSGLLNNEDIIFLNQSVDKKITDLSEHFVENIIGCFPLPLGVVPDFSLDGKKYAVPMVIEETSVIAAVSNMVKLVNQTGEIKTNLHGEDIIGQIQLPKIRYFSACQKKLESKAEELIALVNKEVVPNLVLRGGGVNHLTIRKIARGDGTDMAVIHVYMHPCDAMGANLINQVCEFLRQPIESLTQSKANMCILSNLVDSKLTESVVKINLDNNPHINYAQAEKIVEAGLFARLDSYRAATHNKGIMNGIDAVLIATGNDWRAVEAGIHAYAARTGRYRGLSEWTIQSNCLIGKITAPVIVGTVGGVTASHPTAKLNLKLLKIKNAEELSRVVLSVGLLQNLAAMKALTQEGIVRGHMRLHIQNLLISAGANLEEQQALKLLAEQFLKEKNKITQTDMMDLLRQWREKNNVQHT